MQEEANKFAADKESNRGKLLQICKFGDTVRDIEEGLNSKAKIVVGVLSGS